MVNTRWARRVVGVGITAVAVLLGPIGSAGAEFTPKHQIAVSDDRSSGSIRFVVEPVPATFEPGSYKVGLDNNSIGPHVFIAVGGLPDDLTVEELVAFLDSGAPPPAGVFEAGAVFAKPGQSHQTKFDLTTEGQYAYFCPITTPAGTPHYQLGFVGLFDVAAP
jgi:hypothetical protein